MGPFCRRDNCSWVRGVLERLMTHLSMCLVLVWLKVGCLGAVWLAAGWKSAVWVEGVGAMGVAGMLKVGEWLVVLVENLDGTFDCLLKALELQSMLSKLVVRLLRL